MRKKSDRYSEAPNERWEEKERPVETCNLKYAGEFSNPEDLKKSTDALASYVRKNHVKY